MYTCVFVSVCINRKLSLDSHKQCKLHFSGIKLVTIHYTLECCYCCPRKVLNTY